PATRHLSCHEPAPTEIYTLSLHDALPISKGRIQNVRDVGQLMAAVPCQGRVVEAPWNQLDPDSFQPLFLELPGQFLLHRPPLSKDVDAFLVLFEHTPDQDNADFLSQRGKRVERIADDVGKSPDSKEILIQLFEL